MGTTKSLPELARIRAYLKTHGWREAKLLPPAGEMFVYIDLDDDGQPISVFVPASASFFDYPSRVDDIVETIAAIERRSPNAVRIDLLATTLTPTWFPFPSVAEGPFTGYIGAAAATILPSGQRRGNGEIVRSTGLLVASGGDDWEMRGNAAV